MESLCHVLELQGCRPVVLTPTWVEAVRAQAEMGLNIDVRQVKAYRDDLLVWGERTFRDVVDMWPVLEGRGELLVDGVHPDAVGHRLLWDSLKNVWCV